MHKIAVVSDTHVPDNDKQLNPNLIQAIINYSPELIIHAGDFVTYRIKKQFEAIAPVVGVKGNRDLLMPFMPHKRFITIDDVKIGITHGHGSFLSYVLLRFKMLFGKLISFKYYEEIVEKYLEGSDIMIYGHSHCPKIHWQNKHLMFNPGSASFVNNFYPHLRTSFGTLEIEGKSIKANIKFLNPVE